MEKHTVATQEHPDTLRNEKAGELVQLSQLSAMDVLAKLNTALSGLNAADVATRQKLYGPNLVAREQPVGIARELWIRARNPLNALLVSVAALSFLLGDLLSTALVLFMVVLAVGTSFVQEHRSNAAATRLRSLVKNTATARRSGSPTALEFSEVPLESLVPGDIVRVSAGDMIPGDFRLLEAKDLFVNQSALTGESMPAEKFVVAPVDTARATLDLPNMCFMGANVVSGYAIGLIVRTGVKTFFGQLADKVAQSRPPTAFDKGVTRFTLLMLHFILVMVPLVFLINGLTKHDWLQALVFALAVAVGLTPEMLPMIVTVNLAKGALAMSRKRVIVKRLSAIQNLGAMNVLCTDKTGTLTQDRIILKRHLDMQGNESERVLHYAWLNSHFQSGLKNLLDVAVLEHVELGAKLGLDAGYSKVDEVPFDFARRRLSVLVSAPQERHILICKGAVEEIFAVCTTLEVQGNVQTLDPSHFLDAQKQTRALNEDGFRVVALAFKEVPTTQTDISAADETGLTLLGFVTFLDPPKDSAREALAALAVKGVQVKILTGDNDIVTRKVCRDVGLTVGTMVLGGQLSGMDDAALAALAERTTVFAKLTPADKARIVTLLRAQGHVVGFMGDGINDSPALNAADVGISVDTAVDIAKESADIILLEKSLLVLQEGVQEGRKVFSNITKYVRMGASSNFGNMFSVLGASLFLPFLPMLPVQVLVNNLLYDFSQSAIPTDHVDESELAAPRQWDIKGIFKFVVLIGPVSSLFDYATFALMLFVFDAWSAPALFQTGWFVESLLSQTLIIHIIRTSKVPFLQSRASAALLVTTALVCVMGIGLPYTGAGALLGFVPLPGAYWLPLAGLLCAYGVLSFWVKRALVQRWGL